MRNLTRRCGALAALILTLVLPGAASAQVIDDFTSGSYRVALAAGADIAVQRGSMIGGHRRTRLINAANALGQELSLDVRGADGVLVVNSGHQVFHRLELTYGIDELGPAPLDLDLSAAERITIAFDGSDQGLNVNVVLFSSGGLARAQAGTNYARVVGNGTIEFEAADFSPVGLFDWSDVDIIFVVLQSGTSIGGNDFALVSIAAE